MLRHCTSMVFEIASGHGPQEAGVLVMHGRGPFVNRHTDTCISRSCRIYATIVSLSIIYHDGKHHPRSLR
jgi:hypothetical protein